MKAATKLASSLPFGELDRLVKAIGECKSKSEEDRIIAAEVDVLKQRLSDPRLDKTRGREYMVGSSSSWNLNFCCSLLLLWCLRGRLRHTAAAGAATPQQAATFPPEATNSSPQLGCLAPPACPAFAAGRLRNDCLSIVLSQLHAAVAVGNWQPLPLALRPACLCTHPALPCACPMPVLPSCPVLPCVLQVRVMYCEMLGHDVGFAYIPVLQMASDPNLLNKKVWGLCQGPGF